MSYLSQSLRLHFAGQFQATVSTVNNDVTHFNNEKFQPNFQERQEGRTHPNGWWNPEGDGVWRMLGCAITSAFMNDGSPAAASDPALTFSIADSDDSAPAKIVDLDPQQQMVSTLFGLTIRIANTGGETLMSGDFEPSAFTELWSKVRSSAGGDAAFGAMWQSVITVKTWGDVSSSPFLTALKASADANEDLLSIKFNVDLYSMSWPTPGKEGGNDFCRGRVVGTIGPATPKEPARFVIGRQLFSIPPTGQNSTDVNFCSAVVDQDRGVVRLDLGNALPVNGDGTVTSLGDLFLQINEAGTTTPVGTLPQSVYATPGWYPTTAGVVEFPIPDGSLSVLQSQPLQIALASDSAAPSATEQADGSYLRADLFVYRLSPGESATVDFYATRFGQPDVGATIEFFDNPSQLQGTPAPAGTQPGTLAKSGDPYICAPDSALAHSTSITTDATGKAGLTLTGGDPLSFRSYIDGQIFGVGYQLATQNQSALTNPWNFLSVLVFDDFTPDNPPTWWGSVEPIFQQYANLYPVMARFIDLGNFEQVIGYARMLQHAFSLPDCDPNAMPVTRDLSPAKRRAILAWLANPLEGTRPAPAPPGSLTLEATMQIPSETSLQGGKTAAMARRVCQS